MLVLEEIRGDILVSASDKHSASGLVVYSSVSFVLQVDDFKNVGNQNCH